MSDQNRRRRTKTNQSREEQVKRMRIGIGVGIAAVVLLIVFLLVRGTANSGEEPTGTEGTVQVTDSQSETGQEACSGGQQPVQYGFLPVRASGECLSGD